VIDAPQAQSYLDVPSLAIRLAAVVVTTTTSRNSAFQACQEHVVFHLVHVSDLPSQCEAGAQARICSSRITARS